LHNKLESFYIKKIVKTFKKGKNMKKISKKQIIRYVIEVEKYLPEEIEGFSKSELLDLVFSKRDLLAEAEAK